MKKIIDGKRYDTETANLCGSTSYSYRGDFNFWEEELYQKRTGEFFLYGVGGPMTKYSISTGQNTWSGGEKIIPLSLEAAKKWAEKFLDVDTYEEIFGIVSEDEDETRKALNLSLPVGTIQKLRQAATEKSVSVSDLICELVGDKI